MTLHARLGSPGKHGSGSRPSSRLAPIKEHSEAARHPHAMNPSEPAILEQPESQQHSSSGVPAAFYDTANQLPLPLLHAASAPPTLQEVSGGQL